MSKIVPANPITDLLQKLPAKVRLTVYTVLSVASLLYGLYVAAGGDWKQAAAALFTLLVGATAASNVDHSADAA